MSGIETARICENLAHRRTRLEYAIRLGYPAHIKRCQARVDALEAMLARLDADSNA